MKAIDPREKWPLHLRALREELREEIDRVKDLRAVTLHKAELEILLRDLDGQLLRATRAPVIALVGATGAGKSALLNALVGRPIAVEGIDRPTTWQPVVYAPRDADVAELLGCEGSTAECGGPLPKPKVILYNPAVATWTAEVVIDTPDLNSVVQAHRDTVIALAERSDILIVVLHRQSVVEESPVSFLDRFARRRALILVLNRVDELTDAARAALLEQIRHLADTRWGAQDAPVLALSARAAQQQATAEWIEFRRILHRMVRDNALLGIRRHNALGVVDRIAALFANVREEVAPDLDALPVAVAAGLAGMVQRAATEIAQRLVLRRTDVCRLLWAQASERWDGPGGWALRVGGPSALGVGAAALLAGRSPLLATGAAVGGLAAEKVREAVESHRLTGCDGLLPSPNEFAAWYAETMSPARIRAARLVGEPEAVELPSVENAAAVGAELVAETWDLFVRRDLPAAAEQSLLRFFRLALDVPVYALGMWVLYHVAAGFVVGKYVGVDLLTNAALLAAAYLFAVRLTLRRILALRANRLLRNVIARCRTEMTLRFDAFRERVEGNVRIRWAALERLSQLPTAWRGRLAQAAARQPVTAHTDSEGKGRNPRDEQQGR